MTDCILITGVHGFCARHLVKHLISEGMSNIYGVDIRPEPPEELDLKGYLRLDITDNSKVNDVVCSVKPDMIFHLAGLSLGDSIELYQVNFMGSVYLMGAVHRLVPQARILLVGSAAEYGHVPEGEMPILETYSCNPHTPYGISKYAMTLAAMSYARDYDVKVVVARPFNIVGAGMPAWLVIGAVLARIKKAIKKGIEPAVISVGNYDTERDFIAVKDVVDAYLAMIRSNCWGEVFNICSGEPCSIRNILLSLAKNSKQKIDYQVDASLVRTSDVRCVYGSGEKARRIIGFVPKVALEKALKSAWDETCGDI